MHVEQIMTREVYGCTPQDTLQTAARTMWEHDCGCVPVLDDAGRVAGMLTDRDICMAALSTGRPLHELRVDGAMATDIASCHPRDAVSRAETAMQERQLHRLPVVEHDGHLVGIVSLNDISRAAISERGRRSINAEEVVHTLAAVCRPRLVPITAAPKPAGLALVASA